MLGSLPQHPQYVFVLWCISARELTLFILLSTECVTLHIFGQTTEEAEGDSLHLSLERHRKIP
jgi:hypothetical protein